MLTQTAHKKKMLFMDKGEQEGICRKIRRTTKNSMPIKMYDTNERIIKEEILFYALSEVICHVF